MTNNNKNNINQQNNNASNFDDSVFNPKSTIPEPKRKPGDDVNIEKTDFKDYDSILKCDCCHKAVGFFSIADVRPYIDSQCFYV